MVSLMTADIAEVIAALIASALFLGALAGCWARLTGKLTNHEVRITKGERIAENTARIQERSMVQLAAIEERTKHL